MKTIEELAAQFPGTGQTHMTGGLHFNGKITTDRQAVELANYLRTNPVYSLHFTEGSFVSEGAMQIIAREGIAHCKLLKSIDMEYLAGYGALGSQALLDVIGAQHHIATVHFNKFVMDSECGKEIRQITSGRYEEYAASNSLSNYVKASWAFIPEPMLPLPMEDHIYVMDAGIEGANCFTIDQLKAQFPEVRYDERSGSLDFKGTVETEIQAINLANFLRTNPVSFLDFERGAIITPAAMQIVATQGIAHCRLLNFIDMDNLDGYEALGSQALVEAIRAQPRITTVGFNKFVMDKECGETIRRIVAEHPKSDNKMHDFIEACKVFIPEPMLSLPIALPDAPAAAAAVVEVEPVIDVESRGHKRGFDLVEAAQSKEQELSILDIFVHNTLDLIKNEDISAALNGQGVVFESDVE